MSSSSYSSGLKIAIKNRSYTNYKEESYHISNVRTFGELKQKIMKNHIKTSKHINYTGGTIKIYKKIDPDIELSDSESILDYMDKDIYYEVLYELNFLLESDLFGLKCSFTQYIPHGYTFGQIYEKLEKLINIPSDIIIIKAVSRDVFYNKKTFYYDSSKEKDFKISNVNSINFNRLSTNENSQLFIVNIDSESFPLFMPKNSIKSDLIQHLRNVSMLNQPVDSTDGYEYKINDNEFDLLPSDEDCIYSIDIHSLRKTIDIKYFITDKNLQFKKQVDPEDTVGSLFKCQEVGNNYQIYIESEPIPNDTTFQLISSKYPNSVLEFIPFIQMEAKIMDFATVTVCITSKWNANDIKLEIINQIRVNPKIFDSLNSIIPENREYLKRMQPNNLFYIESNGQYKPYFDSDIKRGSFIIGTELKCPNTEIYFELIDLKQPLSEIEKIFYSLDNRILYCGGTKFTKDDIFSDKVLHYVDKSSRNSVDLHFNFIYKSEANKSLLFDETTLIFNIKERIKYETRYERVYLYINQRLLQDYEQVQYIPQNSIVYVDYHEPKLCKLVFAQLNSDSSIHFYEGYFKSDAKISDVYDYLESYNIGKMINRYEKSSNCILSLPSFLTVQNDDILVFDDFVFDKTIFDTRFLHDPNPIIEYQYENKNFEIKIPEEETVATLLNMISKRHSESNQKFCAQFLNNEMYIQPDIKISEIKFQIKIIKVYDIRCKFILPTGTVFKKSFSIIEPISKVIKKLSEKLDAEAKLLILSLNNTTTLSTEYLLIQYHINNDDPIFIKISDDHENNQSNDIFFYKYFNCEGLQEFDENEYSERINLNMSIKHKKAEILGNLISQYGRQDLLPHHIKFFLFNYPIENENITFKQLPLNFVYEIRISEQFYFYLPDGGVIIKHFFPETTIKKVKSMISKKTGISAEFIHLFIKWAELEEDDPIVYAKGDNIDITWDTDASIDPSLLQSLYSSSISSSTLLTSSINMDSMTPDKKIDVKTNYIEITYPDGSVKVKYYEELPTAELFINNFSKPFISAGIPMKVRKIQLKVESNGNEFFPLPKQVIYHKVQMNLYNPVERTFKINYNGIAYSQKFNQFCTIESLKNWISEKINIEPDQIDVIHTSPIRCFCDDEVLLSQYCDSQFKIIKCKLFQFKLPDQIETIQIYCSQFTTVKIARYKIAKYLLQKSPVKQCQLSDSVFQDVYNGLLIEGYENDVFPFNNQKVFSIKYKERPSNQEITFINIHTGQTLAKYDSSNKIPINSTIDSIGNNFPRFSACTYKDTFLPFGTSFYSFCIFSGEIYVSMEQIFSFNLPTKKLATKKFRKAMKVEEVKTILINEYNLERCTMQNIGFIYKGNHISNDEYIQAKIPFNSGQINVVKLPHYFYMGKVEGNMTKFDAYYYSLEEAKIGIMNLLNTKDDVIFYYNDERIEKFDKVSNDEIIYFRIGKECLFNINGQQIQGFYSGFKRTKKELAKLINNADENELIFKDGNKTVKKLVPGVLINVEIRKPLHFKIDGANQRIDLYMNENACFSKAIQKLIRMNIVIPISTENNGVERTSSVPSPNSESDKEKTDAIFRCGCLTIKDDDKIGDILNHNADIIISYPIKSYQVLYKKNQFSVELLSIATIRDLWLKVFDILHAEMDKNINAPESIELSVKSKRIDFESYAEQIVEYGVKEEDAIHASLLLNRRGKGINLRNMVVINKTQFNEFGASGDIYLCRPRNEEKLYVVKIISSQFDRHNTERKNFEREVSLLCQLKHKFILKIAGFACKSDKMMIQTPYMKNGTLEKFYFIHPVHPYIDKDLMNNPTQRLIIVYGIAHGMKKMHSRNIIHRDLKPKNIFLDSKMIPRIGDFGLAKSLCGDVNNSQPGSNFPYRDQHCGKELYLEYDVYAFGVILYELYTGVPLSRDNRNMNKWAGGWRPKFDDPIPFGKKPGIESLISMCWDYNTTKRPSFKFITVCLLNEDYQFVGSDKNALYSLLTQIKEKRKTKKLN